METALGVDWPRVRDEILGDAIVVAYRPGPPIGREEAGLFLVRARNVDLLNQLVQRLNDIQQDSGELKELVGCKYQNVSYFCRVEAKGKAFYYLNGPVLAFSHQETAIRQVIDLDRNATVVASVPLARELDVLGANDALVTLWINPRVFEAEIERSCKRVEGAEAAVRKAVLAYWKALDAAALLVHLRKSDLELKLTFRISEARLPSAARKLMERGSRASELWQCFPQGAILTVAGRFEPAAWNEFVTGLLNEDARLALRRAVDRGRAPPWGKTWVARYFRISGRIGASASRRRLRPTKHGFRK